MEMFFLYAFTTLFCAASYPIVGQVGLLAFTTTCYVTLMAVQGWPIEPPDMVARLGLLVILAWMSSFLSKELITGMISKADVGDESDRRASLLAVVADAARAVSTLDSEEVLDAVVKAATGLGFEASSLAVYDRDDGTYRVVHPVGLPTEYASTTHPIYSGMPGMVFDREETILVDDTEATRGHPVPGSAGVPLGDRHARLRPGRDRRGAGGRHPVGARAHAPRMWKPSSSWPRWPDGPWRTPSDSRTSAGPTSAWRSSTASSRTSCRTSRTSSGRRSPPSRASGRPWSSCGTGRDADRRELLSTLNSNAVSLHQIITTLLDFSQLEAGRLDVHWQDVDVDGPGRRPAAPVARRALEPPVEVDAPERVVVHADAVLLDRVLENLLSNAVKHTPAGTPVAVSVRADGRHAEVTVADRGPGISEEELPHIGERFFRGGDPNTRRTRGTGLGLALVKEILRLHGTDLDVESQLEQGSRFSFRMPSAIGPTWASLRRRLLPVRRALGLALILAALPAGVPAQPPATASIAAHPGGVERAVPHPGDRDPRPGPASGRRAAVRLPARPRDERVAMGSRETGGLSDVHLRRRHDLFCAGHSLLPDGRVLITGGTRWHAHGEQGTRQNAMFDPASSTWPGVPGLHDARWYPSNVTLPDGRVLIFSGQRNERRVTRTVEVYDPGTGEVSLLPNSANRFLDLYPRMHLLPDGRLFYSGPRPMSSYFDPATSSWEGAAPMGYRGRWAGASVLLPGLDRVLTVGGTRNKRPTNTAEIIDVTAPQPQWRFTASMAHARSHANAVLLPDETVLVIGGGQRGDYSKVVRQAELFDPVGETWTPLASQRAGRAYHSSAVLLPDGRVLSVGMDHGRFERTGEIYSPPYLFRGPRPVIDDAPGEIGYGSPFSVDTAATDVSRVALIRPGSATHGVDFEQRIVDLAFVEGPDGLSVTAPADPRIAPPGHYMVFLVDEDGVPSVAAWTHLT